ncbi:MAG: tetratricopeptide repeat protein, partial [Gammaproteobacteria bacterium]
MTDARVREAAEAYGSGDLARARRVIRQVLEDRDRDPLAWRMLGVIDAAGGDLVSARKALVRSLELEPAQSETLLELARIDLAEGRRNEAAAGFRKAIEKEGRPEILVRAGEGLGNLGFLGEAETCFRAALEKAPDLEAARFNLALARLAAGDAEQGRELLARVVAARPGLAPAWLHLGGALNALGRYREAMEAFRKVLELAPHDPRALAWLGASLQFLGDF